MLATLKRVLGDEHPNTLQTAGNLASTYRDQGKHAEAEALKIELLATLKRVLGDEHPSTLLTTGNLASTYLDQGKHAEAEVLYIGVLATLKRVHTLGGDHDCTLYAAATLGLAMALSKLGQHDEATVMLRTTHGTLAQVLGADHSYTLRVAGALGHALTSQAEAEGWELLCATHAKLL